MLDYTNFINALGIFLVNIDNVPLELPQIQILHETNSIPVLKEKLINTYKQIIFSTIFKVLGSVNLIGNPINFFNEVSEGFKDFVNNPRE